jgi:hypothetical protein
LGLRKAEQRVILGGDLNRELPCMVNDASMGGIRFTTFDSGDIKKGDSAAVLLDFSDPIERITLKGIIQAVIIKSGEQKNTGASGGMPAKFAIISLKFQDDPPLSYKRRLKAFVENNKENK